MIDFTERDSLDSFEIFIENFEFRREEYNFHTLLGIFIKSLENDIQNGYNKNEWEKVKNAVKKAIYKHFRNTDFNVLYNKKEILEIVFEK